MALNLSLMHQNIENRPYLLTISQTNGRSSQSGFIIPPAYENSHEIFACFD